MGTDPGTHAGPDCLGEVMNRELAIRVANAVLYEGYMLYPYRPSAIKNRQRWSFGILYPPAYSEVLNGTERSVMHSECLLQFHGDLKVELEIRFLHLMAREVAQSVDGRPQLVRSLLFNGRLMESWDEGVERSVQLELRTLANSQAEAQFSFPASYTAEPLGEGAEQVGILSRTQHELSGTISVCSKQIREDVLKLTIEVTNTTALPTDALDRNAALLRSLLSAHMILTASDGEFVSLLDPPEVLRAEAGACRNIGNFPVLVGAPDNGERDMLLCSPIILYDYPQIAPESAGDFYDATEMDEMLTLRVMTLTESEKKEMRLGDDRVCELLDRTEQSAREQLLRTHGTIRTVRSASEEP
jgi:hypothetical protein